MSYSSISKRCCANFIDSCICGVINSVVGMMFGDGWFSIIVSLMISAGYFILSEGGDYHATYGKKAMGIIVVDEKGKGIDYSTAAKRYFGKVFSALILCIGHIIALFSDDNCTLYDKMAKTYVVEGAYPKKKYRLQKIKGLECIKCHF